MLMKMFWISGADTYCLWYNFSWVRPHGNSWLVLSVPSFFVFCIVANLMHIYWLWKSWNNMRFKNEKQFISGKMCVANTRTIKQNSPWFPFWNIVLAPRLYVTCKSWIVILMNDRTFITWLNVQTMLNLTVL